MAGGPGEARRGRRTAGLMKEAWAFENGRTGLGWPAGSGISSTLLENRWIPVMLARTVTNEKEEQGREVRGLSDVYQPVSGRLWLDVRILVPGLLGVDVAPAAVGANPQTT